VTTHTLTRTGRPALRVEGEAIYDGTTKTHTGDAQNRWHEVTAYELDGGGYVAHVRYRSLWEDERAGAEVALEAATLAALADELRGYNPVKHVLGRPERDEEERRRNGPRNRVITSGLRSRWEHLVSELCAALGVVEEARGPGRPALAAGEGESPAVGVRFPAEELAELDANRGEESRSSYIRRAVALLNARSRRGQ
jgi:hypothetical protein